MAHLFISLYQRTENTRLRMVAPKASHVHICDELFGISYVKVHTAYESGISVSFLKDHQLYQAHEKIMFCNAVKVFSKLLNESKLLYNLMQILYPHFRFSMF